MNGVSGAILPDDEEIEDYTELELKEGWDDANPGEEVDEEKLGLELEAYPRLYQHCARLYNFMLRDSIGDPTDPKEKIYIGTITPLIVEIGIAPSYQSKVISRLKSMGCVSMLKRGSGAVKSVWGLYKQPTIEAFNASDGTGDFHWRQERQKFDAANQRIIDLTRRLTALEDWARAQGAPF